jgi:2-isopropylmalate synthase
MSTNEVLATAVRAVEYAASLFDDVEFSAEDAFRTEPEFLADVLEAAADAGARTLNVPDTVGYATPEEVRETYRHLAARIHRRHPQVIFSAHCHDDLGMAEYEAIEAFVRWQL